MGLKAEHIAIMATKNTTILCISPTHTLQSSKNLKQEVIKASRVSTVPGGLSLGLCFLHILFKSEETSLFIHVVEFMLARAVRSGVRNASRAFSTIPTPKVFDYATVTANLKPSLEIVNAIEDGFGKLAKGEVDVPLPMHIGIDETSVAGPGDCHIKGGYIAGTTTWTVKLANVSFYKNLERGLPPGAGIFICCDAVIGMPLAVFQENRYMTDLRTGAAGAVSVKYFGSSPKHEAVSFIGGGAIASVMAKSSHVVHKFKKGYVYGLDTAISEKFAKEIEAELGYPVEVCGTAEECVRAGDVIFTQTPAAETVLELDWLKPHATIIASGSDQPTKNEIPPDVMRPQNLSQILLANAPA